jgi:hypothetical protein
LTGEAWRTIPGFRKYKITRDGDVKNVRTGKLLKESQNPTTGAYHYTLHKDGGGKTSRNFQSLIDLAWSGADDLADHRAKKEKIMECEHPNPYNDWECPECGVPIENWEPNDLQIPGTYEIRKAA